MPVPIVYVPLAAIFPEMSSDFATFCALVRTLSCTDTIFWCARLGLILANPHNTNGRGKQQYAVQTFLDTEEIGRLNQFVKEHPNSGLFFRGQLLELIRWTSLLGEEQANDGNTYNDPETRRRFVQAALMASDLWGRRIYRDGLPLTEDRLMNRRQAMPALREGVTLPAQDFGRVLVRGDAFYRTAFQSGYTNADREFLETTGLTLEQYMVCVRLILIHAGYMSPESLTPDKWGCIRLGLVRQAIPAVMQAPFDRYIELESQTADELRTALWGDRAPRDASEADSFDAQPLRDRPLLRTPDGRAIILDHVFYAEKATVGPLFALVKALDERQLRGRINEAFKAFGQAFESYINQLLRNMYPSSPVLPARLMCNPHADTLDGDEVEIADACLNDLREVVLFESKGVFVPDDAAHDAETYLVALRKKYGAHEGRPCGAAQIGRWLSGIVSGAVTPTGQDWTRVELVYPVLVVYDVRMDRPGHAEFLLEEFTKAFEPEEVLASGYMRKGSFSVAPLTVMTIGDLEVLESSVDHFRLTDLLKDYALSGQGGIRESLHDYLAFAQDKYKLSMSKHARRAEALLLETRKAMFPQEPLPKMPTDS
jgi:hypothetical protein